MKDQHVGCVLYEILHSPGMIKRNCVEGDTQAGSEVINELQRRAGGPEKIATEE